MELESWFNRLIGKKEELVEKKQFRKGEGSLEEIRKAMKEIERRAQSLDEKLHFEETRRQKFKTLQSTYNGSINTPMVNYDPYGTITSTPSGTAINIPGNIGMQINNSSLGSGISWSHIMPDYNEFSDEEKAIKIVQMLESVGLTDVSNHAMLMAIKSLAARNPKAITPEKQPKKKLDL